MSEMSDQQRAAAEAQSRELRETGAYLLGAAAGHSLLFWLTGALVFNFLVLPNLATLEATTCR